jgi:hypothetical protein
MRWFAPSSSRVDPVRALQEALAASAHLSWDTMVDALDVILGEELWQVGGQFDCFAEFAIGLPPTGLGVRSLRPLKLLRHTLLANGYFAPWTELLERIARQPGRPRKTLVNDEGFQRFYTVPTAATARDRLLLALKRHHPEHFMAVCNFECSPREAGIRTGLIKVGGWYYGGVCDIAAAAALRERAQARLLCELFKAVAPSAQCTLIAREIEPRLEAGLATRWRDRMGPSG